ncbi:MAG: ABC transporter ATP-binding protein [Dehalococcoidia bacterium]|jgi:ATP-binding cassette subfamily B protein|nr:ABC transporter ATP-binding protein [Dehalococcoidia bacterium]
MKKKKFTMISINKSAKIKKREKKAEFLEDSLEVISSYDQEVLNKFIQYLKPYRKKVFSGLIAVLLFTGVVVSIPIIVKITIDNAISQKDSFSLNLMFIILLISSFIHLLSNYFQQKLLGKIGENVIFDIRTKMFAHIQKLSMSFSDKTKYGGLMSRVQGDVGALQELFQAGIHSIADILTLICVAIILISLNWIMGLMILIVLPILILVRMFWLPLARRAFLDASKAKSIVSGVLNEHLNGVRVTQSLNREFKNQELFDEKIAESLSKQDKAAKFGAGIMPPVETLTGLSMAIIIVTGGYLVTNGAIEVGIMVASILYIQRLFDPIRTLTMHYSVVQRAMASGHRIFELLELPVDIKDSRNANPLKIEEGKIELKNVNFGYESNNQILHNINLSIEKNETIGLVGPTGSGKTSIAALIHRFYEIWDGEILIDGQDIRKVTQDSLGFNISMVLQDPIIFSGSVLENIRYRTNASDEEIIKACKTVGADEFITRLPDQYSTHLYEGGSNLSIGEKQLLSFARALVCDSKIFILDEATAYIDSYTESKIQNALKKVLENRTGIIIAHRLSTIKNSDKIVVLDKGRILEIGPHDELMKNKGLYSNLWSKHQSSFDDLDVN